MARHRSVRAEEAEAALAKAKLIVAKVDDPARAWQFSSDAHGPMFGWILCREAEELLKQK